MASEVETTISSSLTSSHLDILAKTALNSSHKGLGSNFIMGRFGRTITFQVLLFFLSGKCFHVFIGKCTVGEDGVQEFIVYCTRSSRKPNSWVGNQVNVFALTLTEIIRYVGSRILNRRKNEHA